MYSKCYKCFRPLKSCYCADIAPVDTGIKFVILMHPKEAYKQRVGTGRLTSLSIIESEIIIGVDFTHNKRLNSLISGEGEYGQYFPVVLFPARDAYFTDTPAFRDVIGMKKLLIILVDATWFLAEKIIRLSTNLKPLPKLSFKNNYLSQFQIKAQPDPACLSTIESSYYLIEELKTAGIAKREADQSGLMKVFHKMIDFQQTCERTAPKRKS